MWLTVIAISWLITAISFLCTKTTGEMRNEIWKNSNKMDSQNQLNVFARNPFVRHRNQLYFSETVNYIEHWTNLFGIFTKQLDIKRRKFDSIIRLMYRTVYLCLIRNGKESNWWCCVVREPIKRHSGKRVHREMGNESNLTQHITPCHIAWQDTICQSDVITQSWWFFFVRCCCRCCFGWCT